METIRNTARTQIDALLQNEYETRNTERAIFNYAIVSCNQHGQFAHWTTPFFRKVYRMKAVELLANLDPEGPVGNKTLLARFKSDPNFRPDQLIFGSPHMLFPERYEEYFEQQRALAEAMQNDNEKSYTNEFVCPKCHARKATYIEVMTRSADEPMTLFVTCAVCKHKFRR